MVKIHHISQTYFNPPALTQPLIPNMSSSYVLTGGTGNTSLKIAAQLHEAGHKVIVASTKGPEGVPAPYTGVKFDWTDESTYSNALPSDANIKGLYLLSPYLAITVDNVKNFIHLARERGVNRFVSMTATTPPPHHLEIEAYIKEIGKEGVEWTILKPSWFYGKYQLLLQRVRGRSLTIICTENFTRDLFAPTINASDSFNSATQNGKMGLVSSDDIADIAVRALTDTVPHNIAHIIFGPELLTYDDVSDAYWLLSPNSF